MLKVVVFDGGYGGELFADKLKEELTVIEVIRVIDWRNADKLLLNTKTARKIAYQAIRPYIGSVDLIIFANYFLTVTSLKYFKRKFKNQKFVGFKLKEPDITSRQDAIILATRSITRTINYHNFLFKIKRNVRTLILDDWAHKIDDGELQFNEIKETLQKFVQYGKNQPKEVILACTQFSDIKYEIRRALGWNVKIYDGFNDTFEKVCKILGLRGGVGKKKY